MEKEDDKYQAGPNGQSLVVWQRVLVSTHYGIILLNLPSQAEPTWTSTDDCPLVGACMGKRVLRPLTLPSHGQDMFVTKKVILKTMIY